MIPTQLLDSLPLSVSDTGIPAFLWQENLPFRFYDVAGLILILLVVGLVGWIWRRQSTRYFRIQQELEKKVSLIEKNYILLSENANDIILLLDEKGILLWVNARAVQMYGFPKFELIGKHLFEIRMNATRAQVMEILDTIAREGGKVYEEFHKTRDGLVFPVEVSARLIEISRVKFFQCIIRDITERKKAGEALQESEKRYRELFNNANDIIYTIDLNGRFVEFNKMAEQVTGYTLADAPRLTVNEVVAPEFLEHTLQMMKQKSGDTDRTIYELEILTRDGKRVPVEINSRLIYQEGKPVGVQGIARDITERKKAREALDLQKAFFQQLFENSPEGIVMLDNADRVVNSNQGFEKLFQYSSDEISGRLINDLIVPEEKKQEATLLSKTVYSQEVVHRETIRVRKDGSPVQVSILGFPIILDQNQIGVYGIYSDITERKEAEAALRESEEKFRMLAENIPGVVYLCRNDVRYTMLYLNDEVEKLTGFPKEEFLTDRISFVDLYHPDEARWIPGEVDRALEHRRPFHLVYRIKHRTGGWRWIEEIGVGVFEENRLLFLEGFLNDISERKQADDALRKSEANFQGLFEFAPYAVVVSDQNGSILRINRQAETMFRYKRGDMLGKKVEMLLPEALREGHLKYRQEYMENPRTRAMGAGMDMMGKRKEGESFPVDIMISPLVEEEEKRVLVVIQDITERKRIEEQIRASLREKEVLLKEIHHRVKNNLQVISSLLRLQVGTAGKKRAMDILTESQNRIRSMALIHEKLYQSRELSQIDFSEYIRNLVTSLFRTYGIDSGTVGFRIKAGGIFLGIDTALPCGLIINEIVSNSLKYAFPRGKKGEIRIEMRSEPGSHFLLQVEDNGVGLPANFRFENVRSLGLQLVHSLTEQLNGTIELEHKKGTTFRIRFAELKYKERS